MQLKTNCLLKDEVIQFKLNEAHPFLIIKDASLGCSRGVNIPKQLTSFRFRLCTHSPFYATILKGTIN